MSTLSTRLPRRLTNLVTRQPAASAPRSSFHASSNTPLLAQTDVTQLTKHTPEQLVRMGEDNFFANLIRPLRPTKTREAIGKALSTKKAPSPTQQKYLDRIADPSISRRRRDAAKTALARDENRMEPVQIQYELSKLKTGQPGAWQKLIDRVNG